MAEDGIDAIWLNGSEEDGSEEDGGYDILSETGELLFMEDGLAMELESAPV